MIKLTSSSDRIATQNPAATMQVRGGISTSPLGQLPTESILHIISFLGSPKEVASLGSTCTTLYQISADNLIWKSLFQKQFPNAYSLISHQRDVGFQNLYKELAALGNNVRLAVIGDCVYAGADDERIKIFDLQTGRCLETLQAHKNTITILANDAAILTHVAIAENRLATADSDKNIGSWVLGDGNQYTFGVFTPLLPSDGTIIDLRIVKDHLYATTSRDDSSIKLHVWDMRTQELLSSEYLYEHVAQSM